MQFENPLQLIASAVTPVVLVSATAILISGVNSRYTSIADRVRSLTAEYRRADTTDTRRASISSQLPKFEIRVRLVSWAIRGLNLATACFVAMALIISATLWREMLAIATVPLFIVGILLLMFAIVCELMELQVANRTLFAEMADIEKH